MNNINSGQFLTIEECINSLLGREKDFVGSDRARYTEIAKDVFTDLNLSAVKRTKRALFTIDKKINSISLPDDYLKFSTISVITANGQIEPLVYNTNLIDDVVDMGLDICNDQCGCTDVICNFSKHYEAITEQVMAIMPDNSTKAFTKIIRKYITKTGEAYMEVTEPVAKYTDVNGTRSHTSTELVTTPTLLCKLEMKDCGCVKNSDYNHQQWARFGSSIEHGYDRGIMHEWGCPNPDFYPRDLTYNISDDGKRIIFPSNFGYKKVLIRYYGFESTKDILVPYIAKKPFMLGIVKESMLYDKKAPKWMKDESKLNYNNAVVALRSKMNTLELKEFYEYYFGRDNTRHLYWDNNNNTFNNDYFFSF